MYINPCLYFVYIQTMNEQNITVVKIHSKSLIYLFGGEIANHANFMQPMLISYSSYFKSLEDDGRNVST